MTGTANQLPKLIIRPNGPQNLQTHFGTTLNQEIADQIGVSRPQVSRVLNGKLRAGNQFIAGIINRCGLEFTFTEVFEVEK